MATSQFIKRHISMGKSIAQSLSDSFNYGQNPIKTRGGELVSAYMCDPKTAVAEFMLSKAQYKAITGREQKNDADVLYYQIRQSFAPGEIDHDTALKIGNDLAMRWTKGKHAYFVVSHIDRPHPHIHVYYNSTALDCTRKFRDFLGSAKALRRLSDRICLAEKPPDMKTFLQSMAAAGFEVKYGRGGVISFRSPAYGQTRYTRLRSSTLGEGYGPEDILDIIEGRATLPESRANVASKANISSKGNFSNGGNIPSEPNTSSRAGVSHSTTPNANPTPKANLIVDIQSKLRAGKGPAYEKWAKIHNLKAMAAALQYLQENNLLQYEQLEQKAAEVTDNFHNLSDKIKSIEAAININTELKTAMVDYAKTRPVFEGYKNTKYSNKYLAEHEADMRTHRAAQATFKRLLAGAKLPKIDTLKAEYKKLAAEKSAAYKDYRATRKAMQNIVTTKANIDHLLNLTDVQKSKDMER